VVEVEVEGSPVREELEVPEVSEKKAAEVVKGEKALNVKGTKKEVGFKLDDETLKTFDKRQREAYD
jgi:hypothetical protein